MGVQDKVGRGAQLIHFGNGVEHCILKSKFPVVDTHSKAM